MLPRERGRRERERERNGAETERDREETKLPFFHTQKNERETSPFAKKPFRSFFSFPLL